MVACTDDGVPPRECLRDYASPAFSPNGRWIAFDAGRRIAVVRANGTGLRLLPAAGRTRGTASRARPGRRTASGSCLTLRAAAPAPRAIRDLYTVAADGSGRAKRVVRDAADPSWSVDRLFAFERPSNAIPPRGGSWSRGRRQPARPSAAAPDAALTSRATRTSPRTDRASSTTRSRGRLTVVGTDGSGTRRLAAATNAAQQPAWSPNGRRLAWWWSGIYVARADGTHAHKIARDRIGPMGSFSFSTFKPSWRPLPPFSIR